MQRLALGLLSAGATLGIVGALPDSPAAISILAALGAVLVLPTLPGRRAARQPLGFSRPERPSIQPLREGERYDTAVKLATIPNAPLADVWCQRLQEEGIHAFTKSGPSSGLGGIYGGATANPAYPVEVWVGEHDVERARELFPELA